MSNRQQISVFKVALESVKEMLRDESLTVEKGDQISSKQVVHFIAREFGSGEPGSKALKFSGNVHEKFRPYTVEGFFATIPVDFGWVDFFAPHLVDGHEVNEKLKAGRRTAHKSFFIFIYTDTSMYCFSGGLGYHYIKDYIDDDFGISILERMVLESEMNLTMLRSRSIVGNVAIDQRVFRNQHRAVDENNLGRIYREAAAQIPYGGGLKDLKKVVFDDKDSGTNNVKAGQSFKFSKALSLSDLKIIAEFFDDTLKKKTSFVLSSLSPVKKEKEHNKVLIERLEKTLMLNLFDGLESCLLGRGTSKNAEYEVTNSKYMSFYESQHIIISRRGSDCVAEFDSPYGLNTRDLLQKIADNDVDHLIGVFKKIKGMTSSVSIQNEKMALIKGYQISCYESQLVKGAIATPLVEGELLKFMTGEFVYNGKPYFYLDNTWYRPQQDFLPKLNADFSSIYSANKYTYKFPAWGEGVSKGAKENENTYLEYVAKRGFPKTLVFHKVHHRAKIELCDLMTWNDEELFLIHIKPSFDGDMRVLAHQIGHSSKLIEEDLRNGDSTDSNLRQYFNTASGYNGESAYLRLVGQQFNGMNYKDFRKLFQKKIRYVACIVDVSRRNLKDIHKFDSNIAKMSTIECYRGMLGSTLPSSLFLIGQVPIK